MKPATYAGRDGTLTNDFQSASISQKMLKWAVSHEWQWLWSFSSGCGAGGKCLFRRHSSVLCDNLSFFQFAIIHFPQKGWIQTYSGYSGCSHCILAICSPVIYCESPLSSDTRPTEKIMISKAFSCPFVSHQLSTYLFSHIFCNKNYRHKKEAHFYPNFQFFVSL